VLTNIVVCIDASQGPSGTEPARKAVEAKEPETVVDAIKPQDKSGDEGMTLQEPPAEVAEPEVEGFKTGSETMDDILEHSQSRMLEAIDILSRRVDVLSQSERLIRAQDARGGGQVVVAPQIAYAESRAAALAREV
jgi:hypothetical protein